MVSASPMASLSPGPASVLPGPGTTGSTLALPGYSRKPSRGRIWLLVITRDVPDIADRQIQLAGGFPGRPGSRMAARQPRGRSGSEPRAEQPVHHEVVHGLGDAVAVLDQEQHR